MLHFIISFDRIISEKIKAAIKRGIRFGYILLLLSMPFSIEYRIGQHAIELPTEPLMILLIFLLGLWMYLEGMSLKRIWKHPMVWISFLWCMWMAIGISTAWDHTITLKYVVVSFTHWILFFFGFLVFFDDGTKWVEKWFNFYSISLLVVLVYAWYTFSSYNFRMDTSVLVARPFYFDHALLSSCLSILLGIYGAKTFLEFRSKSTRSYPYLFIFILLMLGVILSFSRAAWVSLFLSSALITWIVFFKRYRVKTVIASLIGFVVLIMIVSRSVNSEQKSLSRSNTGNWLEHISSIANVQNNVSNLERMNRWRCAYRMFLDRPFLGFGAGSFPKAFLPYQKQEEMTRISVTTPGPHPPGRGGSAHSEYLRAMAEMGLPGFLLFLGIVLSTFYTGLRIYFTSAHSSHRIYALGIIFGLSTFFIHGMFNNFLHQGKLAILFWSSLMVLVLLDEQGMRLKDHQPGMN